MLVDVFLLSPVHRGKVKSAIFAQKLNLSNFNLVKKKSKKSLKIPVWYLDNLNYRYKSLSPVEDGSLSTMFILQSNHKIKMRTGKIGVNEVRYKR